MMSRFWCWLAFQVPRPLAYWCALRVVAFATTGVYSSTDVPTLAAMEALRRWEQA